MTFGNAWKHQVVHVKLANLHWHGWARIMYLNIFYLKCLWEGIKTPSCGEVCTLNWRIGAFRSGQEKYIWIFSIWNDSWQGMKTPSLVHKIGKSALAGMGRNDIFEYLLFGNAFWQCMRTPSFAQKNCESTLARVGKNSVFEYLLFEMPLGRPQNIKLMNIGLQGRAGIIYLNIF